MPKFRPSSLAQMCASVKFNESQLISLIEKGLSDKSLRGYLYKRSSTNSKWRLKWFMLFENLLFYFDVNLERAAELAGPVAGSEPATNPNSSTNTRSPTKSLGSFIRRKSKSSSSNTTAQQPAPFWQQLAIKELMSSPVATRRTSAATGSERGQLEAPPGSLQPDSESGATAGQLDELAGSCHSIHQLDSCGRPNQGRNIAGAASPADHCLASNHSASSGCGREPEALGPPAPTGSLTRAKTTNSPHKLAAAPVQSPKTTTSTTTNSSSISGISNHFQAHNEQTIGRSTTTSAGKTALPTGTNYASLLSRKIGVLFLEGSHCERVCDPNGLTGFRPGSATGNMQSQQPFRCSSGQLSSCTTSNGLGIGSVGQQPEPIRASSLAAQHNYWTTSYPDESELNCMFTLKWIKEGSKEYHFRSETEAECCTWVNALSQARYSVLLNDKEQLEQKFLHLSQIIESESTAKWHYARQCEDSMAEIKKLRQEICHLRRQESRSNHFRVVLSKQSAALVKSIAEQRHHSTLSSCILSNSQQHHQAPDTSFSSSSRIRGAGGGPPSEEACHQEDLLSRGSMILSRAKSMEQEQEEHDVAVRRTRRQLLANHRRNNHQPPVRVGSFDYHHQAGRLSSNNRYKKPLMETRSSINYPSASVRRLPLGSTISTGSGVDESEAMRDGLSAKLGAVIEALNEGFLLSDCMLELENSEEIKKIKKVQGFFRGWLCRRRWKQIVQEYIKSPHAESMRKRNNLVFRMVECEEEYVDQLTLLVSAFLRPLKMAASSQRPALDHDEVNSIFLNSETLLFLHQIFLKGLTARMESWPTLVLADLFTMLLPMLTIYQEYVRNHHFSIQVLAECKQRETFAQILKRLEDKPQLNGRTLETLLTYPMHQIPRYIICLHEILAHTPHNHVERVHLYTAQTKLEELSRQIHEEVSATESIRHNLAIERMIIGGCDILLDVSQVFVRQGVLTQVLRAPGAGSSGAGGRKPSSAAKARQATSPAPAQSSSAGSTAHTSTSTSTSTGSRWQHQLHQLEQRATSCMGRGVDSINYRASECGSIEIQIQKSHCSEGQGSRFSLSQRCSPARLSEAAPFVQACNSKHDQQPSYNETGGCELVRQCFLFTNHLLLCTREKDGALDLVERISLSEVTLVENPAEFIQQQHHHHDHLTSQDSDKALAELPDQLADICDAHQGASSGNLTCRGSIQASDYSYHQDGASIREAKTETGKRASSASEPAKWATLGSARTPNMPIGQNGSRSSASIGQLSWRAGGAPAGPGGSPSRAARTLTGYLASKLSNLTASGAAQAATGGAGSGRSSASAPASPLNKRRKNSSQATAAWGLSLATCRDYAGRDFLLLLDPNGKQMGAAHPQTCAFYLVAPTVREKAAWMSDISQVSTTTLLY